MKNEKTLRGKQATLKIAPPTDELLSRLAKIADSAYERVRGVESEDTGGDAYLSDSDVAADVKNAMMMSAILAEIAKFAEEERGKHTTTLKSHMEVWLNGAEKGKIALGPVSVSYYVTERKTLKPEKLVMNGVDPEVINKCYEVSKSAGVRVAVVKETQSALHEEGR